MAVKFTPKAPKPWPAGQIGELEEQNEKLRSQVAALETAISDGLNLYKGDLGNA